MSTGQFQLPRYLETKLGCIKISPSEQRPKTQKDDKCIQALYQNKNGQLSLVIVKFIRLKDQKKYRQWELNQEIANDPDNKYVMSYIDSFEWVFKTKEYNQLYFVMVFPKYDMDLRQFIRKENLMCLNIERRSKIMSQIIIQMIQAVLYMHGKKVAIRDIKPDNFVVKYLESQGLWRVKLIDIGSAKEFIYGNQEQTKTYCGTTIYMPPQMLSNFLWQNSKKIRSHYDLFLVDSWCLGVTIYELVSLNCFFMDHEQLSNAIHQKNQIKLQKIESKMNQRFLGFVKQYLQQQNNFLTSELKSSLKDILLSLIVFNPQDRKKLIFLKGQRIFTRMRGQSFNFSEQKYSQQVRFKALQYSKKMQNQIQERDNIFSVDKINFNDSQDIQEQQNQSISSIFIHENNDISIQMYKKLLIFGFYAR